MPEPKFEIHKDAAGKFRFRLRAPNNEIIAVSEAYEAKPAVKMEFNLLRPMHQKLKSLT